MITKEASTMHEGKCHHCEGRGYQGTAYWDDELDWYIFGADGHSCEYCDGSGLIDAAAMPVISAAVAETV